MSSPDRQALIQTIGHTIMRWQDATQKYDEAVGRIYDLNASERLCLSFLWTGPQTASAVARQIGLTPAAVTALIDRLEKRGFVRRKADPNDRRKVLVEAAEQALRLTETAYLPLSVEGARMLDKYTDAELETVAAFLSDSLALQERMAKLLAERPALSR
ncbi:MarR family winged helix-turn-helix transcriptional regulator [Devosia sp. ZW T5_3]|uniref:MarR family winged helix-turn-helix transcriptional regulator n=1 Tax=Devosia sp. ZW T5_3 TaxID=3378085 RepID=UPI0038532774